MKKDEMNTSQNCNSTPICAPITISWAVPQAELLQTWIWPLRDFPTNIFRAWQSFNASSVLTRGGILRYQQGPLIYNMTVYLLFYVCYTHKALKNIFPSLNSLLLLIRTGFCSFVCFHLSPTWHEKYTLYFLEVDQNEFLNATRRSGIAAKLTAY